MLYIYICIYIYITLYNYYGILGMSGGYPKQSKAFQKRYSTLQLKNMIWPTPGV